MLAFAAISEGFANEHGKIEVVGPNSVDFGKYPAIGKKIAHYRIRNAGKGVLKILKVRKTCGCASATCDKKELKPKETATVEVVILPNSIFGLYSKNTFVESSDPGNRFLRLNVGGNATPLVKIEPKNFIHAGRMQTDKPWTQSFTLTASVPILKLGKPKVEKSHPAETDLKPVGKSANRYQFSVVLVPTTQSGDFNCSVEIPILTPSNHPPLRLGVSGKIGKELSAVPGILRIPLSEKPVKKTFFLRVLGQRTRILKPDELKAPEDDRTSFEARTDRRRGGLMVTATFSPEFTKALFAEKRIPISFSVPGASSARIVCKTRN